MGVVIDTTLFIRRTRETRAHARHERKNIQEGYQSVTMFLYDLLTML